MVLRPGFEPGSAARENLLFRKEASPRKQFGLSWLEATEYFLQYLRSINYNERTIRKTTLTLFFSLFYVPNCQHIDKLFINNLPTR